MVGDDVVFATDADGGLYAGRSGSLFEAESVSVEDAMAFGTRITPPDDADLTAPTRWTDIEISAVFDRVREEGEDLAPAIAAVEATMSDFELVATSPNDIVAATCTEREKPSHYEKGCFTAHRGYTSGGFLYRPDRFYAVIRSKMSAVKSNKITAGAQFAQNATAIDADPKGQVSISESCRTQSFGIEYGPIKVGDTKTVCPERLSPTETLKSFDVTWHGTAGVSAQRFTQGVDLTKTATGKQRGQVYAYAGSVHMGTNNKLLDGLITIFFG